MDKILGIINLHSDSNFGTLTKRKNISTTSFLGRYYFIDFILSHFTNHSINSIEILVKNKPTSLFKHLSIGAKEWSINTQTGGINLMYNELESKKNYINTDLNTLLSHKKYLYNYPHDYVLVAPCDILSNIDYQKMLESHIASNKLITVAYKNCSNEIENFKSVDKIILSNDKTKLKSFTKDDNNPNVFMQTLIIKRIKLLEILENFESEEQIPSFKDLINYASKFEDVNAYEYQGYMRYFRSLENYVDYSLEMLEPQNYNKLFTPKYPIYTKGYNTPPTIYGKYADVKKCYIANGCNLNGKITNSILGRNVVVEKDAIINNSIIFSNAHIKSGSIIEDAIVENGTTIEEKTRIKGNVQKTAYIQS